MTLPAYSRFLLTAALARGPHTLATLMAAVDGAPWAGGRTETDFSEFLEDLPGVSLIDGHYVSDHAVARGRSIPVARADAGPVGEPGAPRARESRAASEGGFPAALAMVTTDADLTLVRGPVLVGASGANRIRFWIFQDSRPYIGARYLVTLIGNAVSITPDLIARVMRLAEDNHVERSILVGQRTIAAAADAFARGKPVLLVPAPEASRRTASELGA